MNKIIWILGCITALMLNSCEAGLQSGEISLKTEQDSLSYAFGVMSIVGEGGMEKLGLKINTDEYQKGYDFIIGNKEGDYDIQEIIKPLQAMSQEISQRQGKEFTTDDQPFTDIDEFSYAFGAYNSSSYVGCGYKVNGNAMCAGMRDAYDGKERLDEGMLATLSQAFSVGLRNAQIADLAKEGEKNMAEGAAFLAENLTKDGIKSTPSGLQYKVITAGTGTESPSATSTVVVHYEGKLLDGTVFDSSIAKGEPIEYPVNGFIPGWIEALQLMKIGDKFQLYVPSNLAYGERGTGADIGANATLIFDMELLGIK